MSDNRQDRNHLRLARAPRGGLCGPRPSALPATFAGRPVRRTPASCSPTPRYAREPFSDWVVDRRGSERGDGHVGSGVVGGDDDEVGVRALKLMQQYQLFADARRIEIDHAPR